MLRSLAALLLAAIPLSAADLPVKPVYFQTIPYDVLTDARGTPWFRDAGGIHDAKGELVCRQPEGRWLLADRSGRFWFAGPQDHGFASDIRYYEQGKLVDPKIRSRGGVWEDTSGRVFAFDGRAVHILADGHWTTHTNMMPKEVRNTGQAGFVEDPKGRVWMWLTRGSDLGGAWAFDGKTWSRHDMPGAAATDRVRLVLPFADDWFLLAVQPEGGDPNTPPLVPFSPSRTPDQIAKAKPFAGLPLDRMAYRGEALDGKRHFYRHVAYTAQGTDPASSWAVTAAGVVTQVNDDDPRQAIDPRLMALTGPSVTAVTTVFAKPGEQVGRTITTEGKWGGHCRDADGRIYIRGGRMPDMSWTEATHVFWPAKEQFGDVLRMTPFKPEDRVWGLFRDAAGTAFARAYGLTDAIRRWDGARWVKTPIATEAESATVGFDQVGYSTAADGRTVFARVTPRPDRKDDDQPYWVCEAWTHKDGAWSDAHPPAELLAAKRKELIAGRVQPQRTPGPCPVYSDGTRLWFAHNWIITAVDADGTTHAVAVPKPKLYVPPKLAPEDERAKLFRNLSSNAGPRPVRTAPPEPLMLSTIVPLDARSVLVVVAGAPAKTYRATVRVKPAGVTLEPLDAELPGVFPTVHKPADGPPLAWFDHSAAASLLDSIGLREPKWESSYLGHDLYEFRAGKWIKRTDLYKPQAIADDRAVWCLPTDWATAEPKGSKLTLARLHGGKVERFAWNYGEEIEGCVKPAPGAALVGNQCVEPPAKPGGRATLRVFPCADGLDANPLVLPDGTILTGWGHGKLFDPKK
jgi:hypothetical protein